MKMSLLARVGAGFVMGGVLVLVPLGTAQAVDSDLYDSLPDLTSRVSMQRSGDIYESMEPTAAGPQGPVRTDMMKDSRAYDSGDRYGAGKTYSRWSQWYGLDRQIGPIGGYGTN